PGRARRRASGSGEPPHDWAATVAFRAARPLRRVQTRHSGHRKRSVSGPLGISGPIVGAPPRQSRCFPSGSRAHRLDGGGTVSAAIFWLIAAVVFGILEVMSLDFVLIMLAAGALAGAGAAALGAPLIVQAGAAVGVAVLGIFAVRPIALRHLKTGPTALTGVDALIGQQVTVLE